MQPRKVLVVGASPNPERYSNMLIRRLLRAGHTAYPITPKNGPIEGLAVYRDLAAAPRDADVLSLYVNAEVSSRMKDAILEAGVPKVVFNPGAENPTLREELRQKGVDTVEACSLVLLSMDQL